MIRKTVTLILCILFSIAILTAFTGSLSTIAAPLKEVSTFSCADVTEIPQIECEALVALYNSTNGPGWRDNTNWLVTYTPSNWMGVQDPDGHVYYLSLGHQYLNGTIPSELGNLIYLRFLYLDDNHLEGDIPESLINLVNLCPEGCGEEPPQGLILDYNYLNIPPDYPNPNNPLHVFLERENPLWDIRQISPFVNCSSVIEIPQEECLALVALYNSTNGTGWANNKNWLVTNTPGNWCGVGMYGPHVSAIDLHDNQLSGSLPSELDNLTTLWDLILSNNHLGGSIPPQLGMMINLRHLFLDNNQLYGAIPPELGNMSDLEGIELSHNQLSGSIPPELGQLHVYEGLHLENNHLSGSIPPELGNLYSTGMINLSNNQLSGSIPPELSKIDLFNLYLDNNQLSGTIPPELGNVTYMHVLSLSGNQLSGGIPVELGKLSSLISLNLKSNQLSGSIPPELENLTYLEILNLSSNQLSGSIPSQLVSLTYMTTLDLSSNQLIGNIPSELGSITSLKSLWLQNNKLSGDIPTTFINLVNIYDPGQNNGQDGLELDFNLLNVPPNYPDPLDPLQIFLSKKDSDWQLSQGFQKVIGAGGGELTSQDGRTDFLIPAGALITDTTFTFIPQPTPRHDHLGLVFAQNSFELTAEDAGGNPVAAFNLPITVTLTYTDTDFGAIPEDSLMLDYWDVAGNTWTDAITTCPGGEYTRDMEVNQLSLPLCHLTEFGLFGPTLNVYAPFVYHKW